MSAPDSNEAIDAWFASEPSPSTAATAGGNKAAKPTKAGGMCHLCATGWGLVFKNRRRPPRGPRGTSAGKGRPSFSLPLSPSLAAPSGENKQLPSLAAAATPVPPLAEPRAVPAAAADDTHSVASSTKSAASRTHSLPSTFTSTLGSLLHALVSPLSPVADSDTERATAAAAHEPAGGSKSRSLPRLNTAIPSGGSTDAVTDVPTAGGSPRASTTPLSASLPSVFRSVLSLASPTLLSADPMAADADSSPAAPPTEDPAALSTAAGPTAAKPLPTTKSAEMIELEKALGIYTDGQDSYAIVTGSDSEDTDPETERRKRQAAEADTFRVDLRGRLPTAKPVCTPHMAEQLRKHFPALPRLTDAWSLVYSMDQHGISLSTLYDRGRQMLGNKVVQPRGYVLVVQDSNGKKFGAFLSDPLRLSAHAFYGTGETFVFTYDDDTSQIKVYPWTGMNDFFIFGDPQYFAVGASDGKFAIWLDHELERGKSDPTVTFDNPTLSSARDFECYELELWGMSA